MHFVGVAGAGMSALAELLVRRGVHVTGCDAAAATADLEQRGVSVVLGHDPSHVEGAQAVVVTSAMRADHPELARARALGVPVIRRAEALAAAIEGGTVVAVAGTHGKTTTTVMTTETLAAAGLEPTGIAGGRVGQWRGNVSEGSDGLFVVEADEYDRSFLALSPDVAVVTNVEADHLDIYANVGEILDAFAQFVRGAHRIILCAEDPGAMSLPLPASAEIIRYGIRAPDARLVAREVEATAGGSRFIAVYDGEDVSSVELVVPGRHNVLNALAALGVGLSLGADGAALARGLARFHGVERRFQRIGDAGGVTVVDDYAHHPTEIRATLAAARSAFPNRRIVAAFQPHLYSRTRDFADDFGAALAGADAIYLTEIYPAREQPIDGVTSDLIARSLRRASGTLAWRGERGDLADALARGVRPGDVVLVLGAGDITRTAPELVARLTAAA